MKEYMFVGRSEFMDRQMDVANFTALRDGRLTVDATTDFILPAPARRQVREWLRDFGVFERWPADPRRRNNQL